MKTIEKITGPNYVAAGLFAAVGFVCLALAFGDYGRDQIIATAFAAGWCFATALREAL